MLPTTIVPYLSFKGRCEEAIGFYRTALDAEVDMMLRFEESPEPTPPGMLPEGFEKKVMHASFRIQGNVLMASDGCMGGNGTFDGFRLALTVSCEADARQYFAALAEGGSVQMSLDKTFWSPCFGMVTDRFGVCWMVSVATPTA